MGTPGLLDDLEPGTVQPIGPRACVLRGFALPYVHDLLSSLAAIEQASRSDTCSHGRLRHVGRNDELRCARVDDGQARLSVHDRRPRDRPALAGDARYLRTPRARGREGGRLRGLFARCMSHQPLLARRAADLAPGQERARLRRPHRLRIAGHDRSFLFGGFRRSGGTAKVPLRHGDVAVWGEQDRLRYHGVMPLKGGPHPSLGSQRINFTFRKAG